MPQEENFFEQFQKTRERESKTPDDLLKEREEREEGALKKLESVMQKYVLTSEDLGYLDRVINVSSYRFNKEARINDVLKRMKGSRLADRLTPENLEEVIIVIEDVKQVVPEIKEAGEMIERRQNKER